MLKDHEILKIKATQLPLIIELELHQGEVVRYEVGPVDKTVGLHVEESEA